MAPGRCCTQCHYCPRTSNWSVSLEHKNFSRPFSHTIADTSLYVHLTAEQPFPSILQSQFLCQEWVVSWMWLGPAGLDRMELQDKGQDGAYCLLRCKSTNVHTYQSIGAKVSQFFFLFFFCVVVYGESNLVRLTLLRRTCTYVVASTDRWSYLHRYT